MGVCVGGGVYERGKGGGKTVRERRGEGGGGNHTTHTEQGGGEEGRGTQREKEGGGRSLNLDFLL